MNRDPLCMRASTGCIASVLFADRANKRSVRKRDGDLSNTEDIELAPAFYKPPKSTFKEERDEKAAVKAKTEEYDRFQRGVATVM